MKNGEKVEFKSAKNSDVPMIGSVVLEFAMGGNHRFSVPFLVTSTKLSHPILGFNVIEHVVSSGKRDEVLASLMVCVPMGGGVEPAKKSKRFSVRFARS